MQNRMRARIAGPRRLSGIGVPLVALLLLPVPSYPQTFVPFETQITGLTVYAAAWGDYDNDGNLDLVVTGDTTETSSGFVSRVYRNDNGHFVDIHAPLVGVVASSVAWGDYDNDGDLDILLMGAHTLSAAVTRIYRNDQGTFVDIQAPLRGMESGGAAWGDYDNDGDLDVLVAGSFPLEGFFAKIYRNDGNDTFNDIHAGLPGISLGDVAWVDYDDDADLDVFLTGEDRNHELITKMFRNDGGFFVEDSVGLPGLSFGSAAWADYDRDGDMDVFLVGEMSTYEKVSRLYRNDAGRFSQASPDFPYGPGLWGDFNHDNWTDLLLTTSNLFANSPQGFTAVEAGIPPGGTSVALWGDSDHDGRLDVFWSARSGVLILRDTTATPNDPPPAPFALRASPQGRTVLLQWQYEPAGDTSETNVSFNLRIGSRPGASDVLSPMADVASGRRLLPATGNAGFLKQRLIKNLREGTYYWSVQAIDAGFEGSAFSQEESFTITVEPTNHPPTVVFPLLNRALVKDRDIFTLNLNANPIVFSDPDGDPLQYAVSTADSGVAIASISGSTLKVVPVDTGKTTVTVVAEDGRGGKAESAFTVSVILLPQETLFTEVSHGMLNVYGGDAAWGDYDNDGDLDLLITGALLPNGRTTKVYRNDDGTFVDAEAGLPGLVESAAAWGDYDNDGDLDLLLTGYSEHGPITKLFRNDAGAFVDTQTALVNVSSAALAWGDYDNDGDLDILLSGAEASGAGLMTKLFRNDDSAFVDSGMQFTGAEFGDVAWGDYDNDGDLDILLTGQVYPGAITKIYRNDGDTFTDTGTELVSVEFSSAAFGDYDNDGDLDLLITGKGAEGAVAKVYRNDNGEFHDVHAAIVQIGGGGVGWGDYDNDGDLDILVSGFRWADTTTVAKIYENVENSFVDIGAPFTGFDQSSVAWGDYDNDGDLDFALIGINYEGGGARTLLFRNELPVPNTPPTAPLNLVSRIEGDSLILSWDKAADAQTLQDALTYNIRVGTTPGGAEIVSPMADLSSGFRLQPQLGNVDHSTRWVIRGVRARNLYWSVQAIDNTFAGSAFATEQRIVTGIRAEGKGAPVTFGLSQNYPNPFNPATVITYTVPAAAEGERVVLEIYNTLGQKVRTLVDGPARDGAHDVQWRGTDDDGRPVPSGLYIYRLRAAGFEAVKKMVLLQ